MTKSTESLMSQQIKIKGVSPAIERRPGKTTIPKCQVKLYSLSGYLTSTRQQQPCQG